MPIFAYTCPKCEKSYKIFMKEIPKEPKCKFCNREAVRKPKENISRQILETKDNGNMPQKITQFQDEESLLKERNEAEENKD